MVKKLKNEWLNQPGKNILAGIVVALALIPEAIAFSIIAGVDPMVGLYAAFIIATVTAIVGGRPAMISGATGAVALLVTPLVKEHGVEYLFAATILMGFIQLLLGILKVGRLMKFIPRSVMIGFVNALGIMIFMSQIEHIFGISISTYIYVITTLLIVYVIPRFFKAIPAPLIAIIVLTALYMYTGSDIRTVGDLGSIKQTLPHFLMPNVPYNLETLQIVFPYSLSMAIVGLVESLLTAKIVDDATDTYSSKNKESRGQGIANIITGFFGGMGGCAMIGQSVINVKSGANSRLSTFTAGIVLIFMIIVLGGVVVQIPMPILAGIMVMVSIGTVDWNSFKYIKKAPKTDALVMILTVIIVLMTHNLAIGVIVGVVFSALFFATKISKIEVIHEELDKKHHFSFKGQIFFVSIDSMMEQIDINIEDSIIKLNFDHAHLWDDSAVDAIDTIVRKFEEKNNIVYVEKLNTDSRKIVSELSQLNENHLN
ncbi:SulP family inorganic anion transporter [Staphylococcus sp. KG4-3]|uniref:SulP family inorganic anion transporter n=1 Tax=Staphylococcus xylosus TaxID=1288 RepID=A0A418IMJ8_STAXY|nr:MULTISPECIES: SulP family inorganic anion transporter [Staphylococcus]MBF0814689.1 SulP family inorganic anion transporter [Staphylococcus saprophyticus]MDW8543388.1 SulP family inorganic anion transporter [Staphylococcus sp. KG4-1]MRF38443.1 sulfate permease [Staphylococcus sp. KY49P]MDW8562811.1 SulP family inorganic anion transporter [Staphylococcus sp. KG4-3]RIN10098.1 SulP family inorganic anion transporter [Staphylococcus xylosus]